MTDSSCEAITIALLDEADLEQAGTLVRQAFATFMGVAEPGEFWNDRDYVRGRFHAPHTAWTKACVGNELVGVACVTRWGSTGIVGPVAVRPDFWDRKVAKRLMAAAVAQLDAWDVAHGGLFTFPNSPRHLGLYQQFGFWPQTLNAVMTRPVQHNPLPFDVLRYGQQPERMAALRAECNALTHTIEPGLEVGGELDAVHEQQLGATLLLPDAQGQIEGFAVCHFGPHSEAGQGVCYIKFAAVRPSDDSLDGLRRLIAACEGLAMAERQQTLMAGVNTARRSAYGWMIEAGFRTDILGITMHRNGRGYDRADVFLLDDWR